jgi:hypothetical protein
VRRINQMHGRFDISPEDMRYVLSTFVVMPSRWLSEYGWRTMTAHEQVACAEYYKELGRHMGIKGLPATYEEFETLLDFYETAHFAYDPQARKVADATLDLVGTFPPNNLAPRRVVRRFGYALMDEPLLDAFRYPRPTRVERALARGALRARARLLRWAPPRKEPRLFRDMPGVRSYPDGFQVEELGTFPPAD